jgi:hypothetical protein
VAGYSGTPLAKKIGVKDEHVVFLDGAPEELDLDTGGARVVTRLPASADVTLSFHTTYAALERRLPTLFERTTTAGMVWVCWPKKSAQKALGIDSDLDENRVRDLGLDLGFVDVKVAAVDDTWSGLKFVRRVRDR